MKVKKNFVLTAFNTKRCPTSFTYRVAEIRATSTSLTAAKLYSLIHLLSAVMSYRKDDRAMRPIYGLGALKILQSP